MLYALDANDVVRLRKLLIAYEQGSLPKFVPDSIVPRTSDARQDVFLGHVTSSIPAATVSGDPAAMQGGTGTFYKVKVDWTQDPPVLTDDTITDQVYKILNTQEIALPTGYYLVAREPQSGFYLPAQTLPPIQAEVTLSTIPHTPPTVNLQGGGTLSAYSGTYTIAGSSPASCWLIADLNSLFSVAVYPSAGNTWTPPLSGWVYQARWKGDFDTSGLPIFEIASWHLANILSNGDGTWTTYAGLISGNSQNIGGTKAFLGQPWSVSTGYPGISAVAGIQFGGRQSFIAGDQSSPANLFISAQGQSILCTSWGICFGVPVDPSNSNYGFQPNGTTGAGPFFGYSETTQLGVVSGGFVYQGATGSDGQGNMFVQGLCVNVGGSGSSGSTDFGSYWQ